MAQADIKDYEFTLIAKGVKKGDAIVSVRLIHKPDGKLVPGAVIFATRLDMGPDGMEMMTASIEPLPSVELGVYRFKLDLSMEGKWRVSLAAKVQGETGTLENRLVLKAAP
ncbi:MAG: FixH family protein [Methylocystis sp.]